MKRLGGIVAVAGATVVLGVAAYRLLLSDDARASLRGCAAGVRDATDKLAELIDRDEYSEEEGLPNREQTIADWQKLGY